MTMTTVCPLQRAMQRIRHAAQVESNRAYIAANPERSAQDIAHELGVSDRTVSRMRREIFPGNGNTSASCPTGNPFQSDNDQPTTTAGQELPGRYRATDNPYQLPDSKATTVMPREVTLALYLERYLRTHGLLHSRLCPDIRQGDSAPTPDELAALAQVLTPEACLDVALDVLACRRCLHYPRESNRASYSPRGNAWTAAPA